MARTMTDTPYQRTGPPYAALARRPPEGPVDVVELASALDVTGHLSGKSAARSPEKPSALAGPARMVPPVPDEPARGRWGDLNGIAPVLAPVLLDESAALVAGRDDARERLPLECPEIELEIGFGRGMFMLERGRLCPRTLMLGIESKVKWAVRVEERCRRQGLHNVVAWAGDARDLLRRMVPDGSLRRVFLHFPDPWWKKRHAKRRLLDASLLSDLTRLLVPGGELFVQTDVRERAAAIIELLRTRAEFDLTGDEGLIAAHPYGAQSNRERRAEANGLPIYRILAVRG